VTHARSALTADLRILAEERAGHPAVKRKMASGARALQIRLRILSGGLSERFGPAHGIIYMRTKRRRRVLATLSIGMMGTLALVGYATHAIEGQNGGRLFLGSAELPHRRVALVLGCAPTLGGRWANPFFVRRMEAAAAVYKAGKADYLLVSGDNHTIDYDEPTAMKEALTQLGVPEQRIVLDYAGFSTSDSVLRANQVFGLTDFCVVSQRDHAMRAIYIARHHQLDAIAFAAEDIPARYGWRTSMREAFARVRTLLDVNVFGRKPHFAGPPVSIGSDG
jgi:vancomycin permeability regulator SanA